LKSCEQKFGLFRRLFIGVLAPTRRGYRVLHFLSSNRTQIRLRLKDIAKGVILGFGYNMGIRLPVGSAAVKAKGLSGVIRSGPGRVRRVKAKSLSGAGQVSQVSRG
jgi:hypothetical protein